MEAIRAEALYKAFGNVQALQGLTFYLENGSIFGFLGPNGAGKTTTIRILTGLARPTSGRAWVAGVEVQTHRREVARLVGYLPEEPVFYSWMTPRELLDYIGSIFGLPADERKQQTRELLELVNLTDVSDRRIGGFSRGMRQRLGVAQALINKPAVLILDEPVSALDPAGRKEILELIQGMRGQCTILMATHILADVERVCDTVGIIANGRLVAQATQEELLNRYGIPILEIEVDPGSEGQIQAWANTLRQAKWLREVSFNGLRARITVTNIEMAKQVVLPSIMQCGLSVRRYEIARPSLEDIFLKLVGEDQS